MPPRTDSFDLEGLRLTSGEGRRLELGVALGSLEMGGERYPVTPPVVPVRLDVSRTTGQGYAMRIRFSAGLEGPCMRCLEPAAPVFDVDAREISQPGEVDELDSPYIVGGVLDLAAWAHDALALMLPATLLCRPDCAGLCPVCGENLNLARPDHQHEPSLDPRWAKLSEIRFEPPATG
ncbi:MAG TPA: DUF177 domain-containing protein [Solirubrobacteraceae bacterium]|jgi:uncharacterized protein|nr:DUF177 domain-containing protein [Solirubrobacteraceae bacterium]